MASPFFIILTEDPSRERQHRIGSSNGCLAVKIMAHIIGLTGPIGAGKSTAAAFFQKNEVPIVDADGISRSLTAEGGLGSTAVARVFGDDYLTPTGAMDRTKMRERVFRDPAALKTLEAILHPLIGEAVDEAFAGLCASPFVVYDCPLLYRSNFRRAALSEILVIDASDAVRLKRILTRPGLTPDTAKRMMATQPPRRAYVDIADLVIVNEGTEDDLHTRLAAHYDLRKTFRNELR